MINIFYHKDMDESRLRRNLKDAGCAKKMIEEYCALPDKKSQQLFLRKHRACLLDILHADQYKIDCLDHLLYLLDKETKEDEECLG